MYGWCERGSGQMGGRRVLSPKLFADTAMKEQQIRAYRELSSDAERLLERAMQPQGFSARGA